MAFIIVIQFTFQFFDVARNSAPLRGTLACFLCAACLAVSFFRLGTHMRVHRMNKANKTRNRSLHVVTYVRFNDVSSSLCRGAPYMAVPYRRNSYNHPPLLRFSPTCSALFLFFAFLLHVRMIYPNILSIRIV